MIINVSLELNQRVKIICEEYETLKTGVITDEISAFLSLNYIERYIEIDNCTFTLQSYLFLLYL